MPRTHTPSPSGPAGSRLAQLLGELDKRLAGARHGDFAERLGRLFDLSDAIALDGATRHKPAGPFSPAENLLQELQEDLLDSRRALLEQLARSFRGETAPSVIALPAPGAGAAPGKRPPFSTYSNFYQAHQRQMIAGVANLRLRCRRQLAAQNARLAHLAELDAVFESGLASYVRQGFAALPGILETRYRTLWQQRDPEQPPAAWLEPHSWLQQFRAELKMLLLAELEARQEPVLGLLEAAREQLAGSTAADNSGGADRAPAAQENHGVRSTP
ncbi:DUF3348 family protein [Haliea sp. E17]|uniref:DUF3348 family protein n=1 Tax=Haliea sp. E17 TaxID=3401576 RepID=UPI003AB015B2